MSVCVCVCDFLSLSFVPAGECNGSCHVALLQLLLLMPLPLLCCMKGGGSGSGIGDRESAERKDERATPTHLTGPLCHLSAFDCQLNYAPPRGVAH